MHIIAVANQKGGVGKTTTAVTLGDGLARAGRRVLIVDLDPQGHVAAALGKDPAPALFRWLVDGAKIEDVTVQARPNLNIIAGDKKTNRVKRHLTTMDFTEHPEQALLNALNNHKYDAVLLDCAPSFDVLHMAALVAADFLIVPTKLDYLAVQGVNELLRSANEVKRSGYNLELVGVLPTFFDRITKETTEQFNKLIEIFGRLVWPPIPQDTKLREAPAYGQTIWEYAPTAAGIVGYRLGERNIGGYRAAMERIKGVLDA